MAYTPTLSDTHDAIVSGAQNAAYNPSLADTQEAVNQIPAQNNLPLTNPPGALHYGASALAGIADIGHGLLNTPHNIANVFSPSLAAKIPTQQDYNFGQMLGVNNPNLLDKLIEGGVQYAPYMIGGEAAIAAKGAESLPLLTRALIQSGAGATFGATQSQNPVSGALLGAGLGAASEAAPALVGATKNAINAVRPQSFAQQLMDSLSGGNTLEGNAQSLASDIRNAYQQQVTNGQAKYQPIFDAYGNNPIYNRVAPIFGTSQKGIYENVGNAARENYSGDLKDLHDNFISNPTLNNAQQLQSQLGAEIGTLKYANAKGNLDTSGKNTLQSYQNARTALLNDMNNYLGTKGLDAVSAYRSATANWDKNITPYLSDSNLAQIAKGEIENPSYSQINSIFKSPEPEIQKVVSDMGEGANNKILFNELGKTNANLTPERLTSAVNQLDNKGLSSYVTPDLQSQFDQVAAKTTNRNFAQRAAGLTAGTIAGAKLGLPYAETIGAGLGYAAAPLANKLSRLFPSGRIPLSDALLNAVRAGYRPVANTTNANIVNALENQK